MTEAGRAEESTDITVDSGHVLASQIVTVRERRSVFGRTSIEMMQACAGLGEGILMPMATADLRLILCLDSVPPLIVTAFNW